MSSVVRRSGRKRKSSIYNSSEYASLDEDEGTVAIGNMKKNRISNSLFVESRPACQKLLSKLMGHEYSWPFNQPVDPVQLGLPDYFDKIHHPMDFSTIQKKLDADAYKTSDEFGNDIRLVFNNCWTYNLPGSDIYVMATVLSGFFEKGFKQIKAKEAKFVEDTEMEEMKSIVDSLRSEHNKLLGELQKLVKETQTPSLLPLPTTPTLYSSPIPTLEAPKKAIIPKKKVQRKQRPPKAPKKKVYDMKDKEILSDKISKLFSENLQKMVEMIAQDIPEDQKKNGEVEIDLAALSDATLQKLEKFVETALKNQQEQMNNRTIPAGEEHTMNNNTSTTTPSTTNNGTNGSDVKKAEESSSDSESDSDSSSSSDSESESEASETEQKPTTTATTTTSTSTPTPTSSTNTTATATTPSTTTAATTSPTTTSTTSPSTTTVKPEQQQTPLPSQV